MNVYPAVREAWVPFTKPLEGWTLWPYQDAIGLIHCGMGNLVDTQPHSAEPTTMILSLPWQRLADGSPATPQDIADAWHAVSARDDLRAQSGYAFEHVSTIRLTSDALGALIARKFDENDAVLGKRFPKLPTWPADAQVGVHSLAWAAGPYFKFPNFEAAARRDPPDFPTMAAEAKLSNERYAKRNAATQLLFRNAAASVATGADPSKLFWPNAAPGVAPQAPGAFASAVGATGGGAPSWSNVAQLAAPQAIVPTRYAVPLVVAGLAAGLGWFVASQKKEVPHGSMG